MAAAPHTVPPRAIALHPLHVALLGGSFALFLGGTLSDAAYGKTYEIQWTNFAAWLNAGGLVFAGFTLLWAVIDLFRPLRRANRGVPYAVVVAVMFVIGFFDALMHSRDAWAAMPGSLILSVVVTALALVALVFGLRAPAGDLR